MNKKQLILASIVLICIFLSGCAILQLPGKVVGGTLKTAWNIAGGVFNLLKKMPKPPPGVF